MKLAVVSGKEKMDTDSVPVQIVESPREEEQKRGLSSKHLLIAGTTVILVAVLVGGFLGAAYIMKQSNKDMTDHFSKVYDMAFKDKGKEVRETVKTNKEEKTTEVKTDKEDGEETVVHNDFKRGVTVFAISKPGSIPVCYVSPLNRSKSMDPETLERYLDNHPSPPNKEAPEEIDDEESYVPADDPIEDTTFLGKRVSQLCKGRNIYWLYPQDIENSKKEMETPEKREKRAVDGRSCPSWAQKWFRLTRTADCLFCCAKDLRIQLYYSGGWKRRIIMTRPWICRVLPKNYCY